MEIKGVVCKSHGSLYGVNTDKAFLECSLAGSLKQNDLKVVAPVAVGDSVVVKPVNNHRGVIEKVLPRKSKLSRPEVLHGYKEQCIVANVDQIIIVHSCRNPKLKLRAIDRYLIMAEVGNLYPLICISKVDLVDTNLIKSELRMYNRIGYKTIFTSAITEEGIDELKDTMKEKISVLAGPSGVGKSTLLNTVQPDLNLRTREISASTNKGKHVTSHVELLKLDFGGYVVDTPGLRTVGLWGVSKSNLGLFFPEIKEKAESCRFANCIHIHEPDCAVKMAVEEGEINLQRYDSYVRILRSLKM